MKGSESLDTENKKLNVKDDKIILSTSLKYLSINCFTSPMMKGYRLGIDFNFIFNQKISVTSLDEFLSWELSVIRDKFPNLLFTHSLNEKITGNKLVISQCNYFAPEGKWIESLKNVDNFTLHSYIDRLQQLLSYSLLSYWQVAEFVELFLKMIARNYPQTANQLGFALLDAVIAAYLNFKLIKVRQPHNFYSFVFNEIQKYFVIHDYKISISKSLVSVGLPIDFLISFFTHPKNNAARQDLFKWGHEQPGIGFADSFDQFWVDSSYSYDEIENFKRMVLPYLSFKINTEFKLSESPQRLLGNTQPPQMWSLPMDYAMQKPPGEYNNKFV